MKILFIVPGSGDAFYCGNCFRDSLYAGALRKAGHDVLVMPLYLPLTDESLKADTQLFFPAVSFYVARKFFTEKPMPSWIERILNSKTMLKLASSMSGATSAAGMEDLTLSMIYGDDAAFSEQANRLTNRFAEHDKPDIIHLSSTLLVGIAKAIKQRFDIPVVCTMQDEEVWIDSLDKKYASMAWRGIAENIMYIDKFITSSNYYRNFIAQKLPQIKNIEVVYPGIDLNKYAAESFPQNPTIGFFYRMNHLNGLDILAEAFVKLKRKNSIRNLKLKIGGGYTGKDRKFIKHVRKILSPYMSDVEIFERYSPGSHAKFYSEITIISVPLTFSEGAGLYLCEAFAAGRPAVEPATGSFGEIMGDAGIIYAENSSDLLADSIEKLLTDSELFSMSCKNAKRLSETRYNAIISSEQLIKIYSNLQPDKID
ncbi:MAG: glycosyltransferase family 4 protein [Prevotellaceae bacterium]|jgi:glycosyltransferase involved in cell wall biosynthesis|nr:glycosyltransferase family 4 protein [Prevotellaceae bacterium]